MGMMIDDALREVDRWKEIVSERMASLSPEERAREGQKTLAWLEEKLGRKLELVRGPQSATVAPSDVQRAGHANQ